MPHVNLSEMSAPELRQLLDSTRQRGEAALSYQILQEMAARRENGGRRGLFRMRRPAERRVIAVDLGDPMEPEDDLPPMPSWRAPLREPEVPVTPLSEPEPAAGPVRRPPRQRKRPPAPAVAPSAAAPVAVVDIEPTPPPAASLERTPLSVREADPEPPEDAVVSTTDEGSRSRPPGIGSLGTLRRGPAVAFAVGAVAAFAVGAAVGVTLGWRVGAINREAPSPRGAPAAASIRTAALARPLTPAPAPVAPLAAEPEPAPQAALDPAVGSPPPDLREGSPAAPDAGEAARDATGVAMELPAPAPASRTAEAAETPRTDSACAAQPTPADREICGDPELRRLQRALRQAYAEALQAHQDRALLRQRQLAWRSDRDTVSDPHRLAQLYEQRIRKLNAATAEARRQR
jgi:uncharacterized protein YecT (DUF1311 family)